MHENDHPHKHHQEQTFTKQEQAAQRPDCASILTDKNEIGQVEVQCHTHSHVHNPREKRRQISRLSRIIGHLEYVKRLMEADEDCSAILMQLSASKSALNGLGKEIISEHISHCITHAVKEGDTSAIEEFKQAIQKFL